MHHLDPVLVYPGVEVSNDHVLGPLADWTDAGDHEMMMEPAWLVPRLLTLVSWCAGAGAVHTAGHCEHVV